MADVPRMTKEELKEKIRQKDIQVLDVRKASDFEQSDEKIVGAVREDPNEVDYWKEKYPARSQLLLYCAWPQEHTSAGTAQKLIESGFANVDVLKGGWNEWKEAGYPTEKKS